MAKGVPDVVRGHEGRGRHVVSTRPLTKADLGRLTEPRRATHVQKLRDSHHQVARMIAAGARMDEVSARSGYGINTIRSLTKSPAFQELVAHYRGLVDQAWLEAQDDYQHILLYNKIKSERMIATRLEDAEEEGTTLPIRELIAISRDAADRTGHGKRVTNTNINVDFASALERALKRSEKARATIVDVEISAPPARPEVGEFRATPPSAAAPDPPGARGSGDDGPSHTVVPLRRRA